MTTVPEKPASYCNVELDKLEFIIYLDPGTESEQMLQLRTEILRTFEPIMVTSMFFSKEFIQKEVDEFLKKAIIIPLSPEELLEDRKNSIRHIFF